MTEYKFKNIQKDIAKLAIQRDLLKNSEKNIMNLQNDPNITIGGIFNVDAYNKKLDRIFSLIQKRTKIEDIIKQLRKQSRIPNPNKMTVKQFKSGLILDTYDMFDELRNIKKINKSNITSIIDKNYRKITLYFLLLILFILIYYFQSINSYLFSDVRNN